MNYSVFVACAMAHDLGKLKDIEIFINSLENEFGNVYYAPKKYPDPTKYPEPKLALKEILNSIADSNVLFLYYPDKVVSGALTELGYALALNKKVVVYTEKIENLSYMLREGYDNLVILTGLNWQEDLIKLLKEYI